MFGGSELIVQYRPRTTTPGDMGLGGTLILLQTYPESAKALEHQIKEVNPRYISTKSDNIVKIPFGETMQFQEALKRLGSFHDFMIYNHLQCSKVLKDVRHTILIFIMSNVILYYFNVTICFMLE